jgi:hypothetical protein
LRYKSLESQSDQGFKRDRLLIVAADEDSLFDRWKPLFDFRIWMAQSHPDFIGARCQILNDKLSPRIIIRPPMILRVLIRSDRVDPEPAVGRQCSADNLQLAPKRHRAIMKNSLPLVSGRKVVEKIVYANRKLIDYFVF